MLLLGGTAEARALAAGLVDRPGLLVTSSLAGRVPDPALPVGRVRVGGFGGVAGLRTWLADNRIDTVVDATHPFAAQITAHAARACTELQVAHVVLARPAWPVGSAHLVDSDTAAAAAIAAHGHRRVFLTTGRSGTAAFAGSDAWFLVRAVTAPDPARRPRHHRVLLSRGPYGLPGELKILRDNRIDALVSKNSGGQMTRPKIDAAAELGVRVVLVDRPALPAGVTVVHTVAETLDWMAGRAGQPG